MTFDAPSETFAHSHVFLGEDHARGERNVWAVIVLTSAMMVAEIVGGAMFGSIALVADGLHMSTHAGALLLAAIAYTMARRRVGDSRFTFGTGKFGDLAGFASAIVLAMIAALVAYESIGRLFAPTPIAFGQAIPIAFLGLVVNAASAWLLSRGGHEHHHHGHGHGHAHDHAHAHDEAFQLAVAGAPYELSVFEEGVPPRFRLRALGGRGLDAAATSLELVRPNGARETYAMVDRGGFLESENTIPEPHQFAATLRIGAGAAQCDFVEHSHAQISVHRDNNLRAAVIHVMADATVSVFVIVGLLLARGFGWLWMDPVAGLLGAGVIVSWSVGLVRDTSAVLLDMNPDAELTRALRAAVEREGDRLVDLHIWRLGPGHLGAILSVETNGARDAGYYRDLVLRVRRFSHLTVEVARRGAAERSAPRFA